mgnify:CR=1 FL=1|jgi:hypothetical protein
MGQVLKYKNPAKLVYLPGCMYCGKLCKYNSEIADPATASNYDKTLYGCNSALQGFSVDEVENEERRK